MSVFENTVVRMFVLVCLLVSVQEWLWMRVYTWECVHVGVCVREWWSLSVAVLFRQKSENGTSKDFSFFVTFWDFFGSTGAHLSIFSMMDSSPDVARRNPWFAFFWQIMSCSHLFEDKRIQRNKGCNSKTMICFTLPGIDTRIRDILGTPCCWLGFRHPCCLEIHCSNYAPSAGRMSIVVNLRFITSKGTTNTSCPTYPLKET